MKGYLSASFFSLIFFAGIILLGAEASRVINEDNTNLVSRISQENSETLQAEYLSFNASRSPYHCGDLRTIKLSTQKVRQKNNTEGFAFLEPYTAAPVSLIPVTGYIRTVLNFTCVQTHHLPIFISHRQIII